jgi:hypothetical protein
MDTDVIANLKRKGWVEVVEVPPSEPAQVVPSEVPLWAFRSVLDLAGLTAQVTAILAAAPGDAGIIARNQWEYATIAERSNETILALAAQLGLSGEQVDAYFIQAGQLAANA